MDYSLRHVKVCCSSCARNSRL